MITEFTNISSVSTQREQSRQLPKATTSNDQVQADNVIRGGFEERQKIANPNEISDVQQQTLEHNKGSGSTFKSSVQELNNSPQLISRNLEFRVDENSGRTVITVRDSETNEIIRQIPNEQFLAVSGRLKALQESNMADDSAMGILFTSKT